MFIEPYHPNKTPHGWIEVICGSMFSGKTEELIRRVNRALIARQKVAIFKPALDVRYDEVKVVSHNKTEIHSNPVQTAKEILLVGRDCDVIGIDEAQFFDEGLIEVCETLARRGKRVILSGLDMDFEGKPFGVMAPLMAIAEFVTKVHAICVRCGGMASFSYRLSASRERLLLGEQDAYEPRCRSCFLKGKSVAEGEGRRDS
ncbi:thymidine kinase [Rhodoflexus caldus]|jgi:thymidine kinase|uniref:thymidine kinase n=1 Tax=Rhodoflexus caldus TaxID=2891236 RepID=UPI002029E950|nr:thymidine kinase [Rhodoflexus caldus]